MLLFSGIPEAFAEGAMTFPVYVFTALFYQHYGETSYIMPFILWYSFHRAGIFFLSCFGTVRNPYKICFFELLGACMGCMLLFFGQDHLWCYSAAAVLVGLGTSGYASMFRTARDEMQEKDLADLRGSLYAGYAVFLLGILLALALGINDVRLMTILLTAFVFGAFLFVAMLWKRRP